MADGAGEQLHVTIAAYIARSTIHYEVYNPLRRVHLWKLLTPKFYASPSAVPVEVRIWKVLEQEIHSNFLLFLMHLQKFPPPSRWPPTRIRIWWVLPPIILMRCFHTKPKGGTALWLNNINPWPILALDPYGSTTSTLVNIMKTKCWQRNKIMPSILDDAIRNQQWKG